MDSSTSSNTPNVTAFVIRDFEGKEIHRLDVSDRSEHETEKIANGLFVKVDPDRFTVDEEYGE